MLKQRCSTFFVLSLAHKSYYQKKIVTSNLSNTVPVPVPLQVQTLKQIRRLSVRFLAAQIMGTRKSLFRQEFQSPTSRREVPCRSSRTQRHPHPYNSISVNHSRPGTIRIKDSQAMDLNFHTFFMTISSKAVLRIRIPNIPIFLTAE